MNWMWRGLGGWEREGRERDRGERERRGEREEGRERGGERESWRYLTGQVG